MIRSDLSTDQQLTAIAQHSADFAEASDGHFDAAVEHCPGWTVADLVAHVTEVHQVSSSGNCCPPLGCGPCGSRPSRRGCDRTSRGDRCGDGVPHLLGGQRHRPGTGQSEQSEIAATAGDLLLWLYGRVTLDTGSVDDALLGRFRRLCFTD